MLSLQRECWWRGSARRVFSLTVTHICHNGNDNNDNDISLIPVGIFFNLPLLPPPWQCCGAGSATDCCPCRHVRKTDACQQGGLKLGSPVKQWSLYSLCDFTVECIRTKVVQSGSPVFIMTPEVWVVPGGFSSNDCWLNPRQYTSVRLWFCISWWTHVLKGEWVC